MALAGTKDAWWGGSPAIRLTRWIPHVPHPRQHAFLWLDCLDAGYGGAAGGGKSDALLMAGMQYVDVPGYAALILRRTFADLSQPGAIMDRAHEWLQGTDAVWNEQKHRWTFPSGAKLQFGHLHHSNDKFNYKSAEFQFIGVDEATDIPAGDLRYMHSRLRRIKGVTIPIRFRWASNPGGVSHRAIKEQYIEPGEPGKVFIPAKLRDNPSLDTAEYIQALDELDPQTRKQLLEGDWDARGDGDYIFTDEQLRAVAARGAVYDKMRADRTMPPPVGSYLVNSADWGVNKHVLILWPLEGGGYYAVEEVVDDTRSVEHIPSLVMAKARPHGWPIMHQRYDAAMPIVNSTYLSKLRSMVTHKIKSMAVPFGKYKQPSIDYLQYLADNTVKGQTPMLAISRANAPVLFEQMQGWTWKDIDLGKTDKEDDHGPDALIAGVAPDAAARASRISSKRRRAIA